MIRNGMLLFLLAHCAPAPELKPPNVDEACARAIECGVLTDANAAACTQCLEHVDLSVLDEIEAEYGPIPPLAEIECGLIDLVVRTFTNIGECVDLCTANTCTWEKT